MEIPRTTFKIIWAECPDCGDRRRPTGERDVNRYGEDYLLFGCSNGHDELASIDIQCEWDEDWTIAEDRTGQMALAIRQYDNLPSQDVLDELGGDSREFGGPIMWQDLQAVYGDEAVLAAYIKIDTLEGES